MPGTALVPSLKEINSDPEFEAMAISKEEFETLWATYIHQAGRQYEPSQ
jgi:hypothetical protein